MSEQFEPIRRGIAGAMRDAKKHGLKVVAWPVHDPSFEIGFLEYEGDYVRAYGIDSQGREGLIIMQRGQFAMQLAFEASETKHKAFGFVRHGAEPV